MSVLPCARRGCSRIMCQRYSDRHGYICNDCFNQLRRLPIGTSVDDFMEDHREEMPELDEFYGEMFPLI